MTATRLLAEAAGPPPLSPAKLAVLALLWLVTVWRLPTAVRAPRTRALWTAFAGVTVLVTLGLPAVTRWVDATSGVHNLVVLIKHLIGLVACKATLTFAAETARPDLADRLRRPHRVVLLTAWAALIVSFSLLDQPTEVVDFYQAYPGSVAAACYALIVAGYLGASMAVGSWLFTTYARRAATRSLRCGLWVLALGTGAGFGYSVLRVCQILLNLADRPMFLAAGVLYAIEWSAIALVLLGSLIPTIGVAARGLRDWRTARRLAPLWSALTTAVPEVVLTARLGRGPRVRLHRLVIEIRDAALVLAPYADASHAEGPHVDADDALSEARWLRLACARRLAGHTPAHPVTAAPGTSFEELDFATETDRLLRLATAYASPAAARAQ
ncbi:MAB_1171c family putative transporter [Kitasatospora azatica]|uniref:MAB_1171c family putative transporter n=1 Tax=Kitasatospora azatica TaxID=58347 RepID=UPI00068D1996|nr:MAB_1171c family putative transporter [Kitasatospora azatica]